MSLNYLVVLIQCKILKIILSMSLKNLKWYLVAHLLIAPRQSVAATEGDQKPQPPVPTLNTKVAFPLRYFSNFWKSLH